MTKLLRAASAAVLLLSAGLAVPARAAAKYKVTWLLAHNNLDFFREAADSFKQTVEQGSHGDIAVEIVTAPSDAQSDSGGQFAGSPEIAAKVAAGEAEMGHSFTDVMSGIDKRYMVFDAPFLFRGYRHMEGVIEGPAGAQLLDGLREHNLVGLALTYSGGASNMATEGKELRRPEDFKGLKVGVYGHEINAAWLKALGATPVALGHRLETIMKLSRQGELDAVSVTWRNFERTELHPRFHTVSLPGSSYLVSVTYVNQKFFESLPKDYQALIQKASRETARIERAKTIQLNETGRVAMAARGVRSSYLSQEDRRAFETALKPVYERSIEPVIGKKLIELIRSAPDAPAHPLVGVDYAGL